MKTLQTIQNELRELVVQGNDLVLAALKKMLKPGTDRYNDYLALEGRYQDVSRQLLQGVVSNEDATLEFNKIRQSLIDFIDGLLENDLPELGSSSTSETGIADVYNGEVLYRIPKKMQLGVEEECVIRLAFDRKLLLHDYQVQVGDVMKDLRISDVMGVELLDPDSDKAFSITTINDTVQFVEKDLVTEWIFCVTPLKEGQHPLVLKISIIEIINGIERKRNEVLKEQVQILTEKIDEDEPGFVSAGYAWQVTGPSEQRAVPDGGGSKGIETQGPAQYPPSPAPAPSPQPAPPSPAPTRSGGGAKKFGVLVGVFAALVVVAISMKVFLAGNSDVTHGEDALTTLDDPEWDGIRKRRNRQELKDFVDKYPGTPESTVALNILDTMETEAWQDAVAINDYSAMQQYLDSFPDGKYADKAAYRMNEINNSMEALVQDSVTIIEEVITPVQPQTNGGKNQVVKKPSNQQPTKKKPSTRPSNSGTTKQNQNQNTTKPPTKRPATNPSPPSNPVDSNKPVLLVSAARRPVFRKCSNKSQRKEEECTKERIHEFLSDGFSYPVEAERKRIQGTVVVSFVVEKDGSISEVTALNKIGGGCEEAAVRLIKKMPKFTPGKNGKGEPIRVQYTQPVTFKMEK